MVCKSVQRLLKSALPHALSGMFNIGQNILNFLTNVTLHCFALFLLHSSCDLSRQRIFFSYDIFVHGSKCQFIDGINLNLTHVCVCCEIMAGILAG